jgi:ABC-type multidrug transport system fused ATPase/permease subunit
MPRIWLEFLAFASLATLILSISFSGDSIASSIPTLAVFTAVAFRVIPTINRVVFAVQNLNFGKEVSKIIIGQVTSSPSIGPSRIPSLSDSDSILKAENIRFAYPNGGREVVSGVSLSIQPGEIVGITGENGSGKSTLVNLLLGLLEPDSGRILIKSSLVNEGKSPESRLIGYVPQSVYLIDNSLKSNIAFGLPLEAVDEKALLDAIRFSCLVDLVESLPEGINTSVGEGGVRLSGGQRQRVGLARAIYGSPALLILDEFTSSLDVDAEGEILSELSLRREALSIVMIAHSERALSICDRVFEMRDGQLYTSKTLRAR